MSSLTYRRIKTESRAREVAAKTDAVRKKGALILILSHLADQGYTQSAQLLAEEASLSLAEFVPADNVSLLQVVADYEAYYDIRFSRKPKLFRRRTASDPLPPTPSSSTPSSSSSLPRRAQTAVPRHSRKTSSSSSSSSSSQRRVPSAKAREARAAKVAADAAYAAPDGMVSAGVQRALAVTTGKTSGGRGSLVVEGGVALPESAASAGAESVMDPSSSPSRFFENRLLKPLPVEQFGWTGELAELAHAITRDIFTENPGVAFGDIAGLDNAKQVLREAMVAPIKYPQLFTGILQPWKGLLLFGPPGTGKTMLAKAVATQCKTTFFNISASSIVSKWRGDSEKLVRVLFDLARYHAPSTIFLDEIDAIMGRRGSGGPGGGEHEGSRRLKTELLIQMDGLARAQDDLVFVLAASNLPWELDPAFLRRLEKRILVDLPSAQAREAMFAANLPPERAPGLDYAALADETQGYSGSDIYLVSKEAAMKPLRRLLHKLDLDSLDHDPAAASEESVELGPVLLSDAEEALASTRPSTSSTLASRYADWEQKHGAN